MLSKQKFLFILLFIIIISSCKQSNESTNERIHSLPVVGLISEGTEVLWKGIYASSKEVANISYEVAKKMAIDFGLEVYLRTLPLDANVRSRVLTHLHNPKYAVRLIPFIITLKNQYTTNDKIKTFTSYLEKQSDLQKIPGFEHSLNEKSVPEFHDKKTSQKSNETSNKSNEMVALVIGIYDSVFIQGESIIAKKLPLFYRRLSNKDQNLIQRTQPLVKKLLENITHSLDEGEIKELLDAVLKNTKNTEAVTISIIDFLRMNVLKNYRLLANKLSREKHLKEWLQRELKEEIKKATPSKLLKYLSFIGQKRRYGVQIIVDGLQGQLIKSLSNIKSNDPFIQKISNTQKNYQKFRPQHEKTQELVPSKYYKFLEHINQNNYNDQKYLPFLKNLYAQYGQSIAKNGIATTPTISIRNLPIIMTGAPIVGPSSIGIPNFHFVDRSKDHGYYFYGNDALLLEELAQENGLKTMFERLQFSNTMSYFAQYDWFSLNSFDSLINLAQGASNRDFGERLMIADLQKRAQVEKRLKILRVDLISKINRLKNTHKINFPRKYATQKSIEQLINEFASLHDQGMPEYVMYYNPWVDHFAHFAGPFSDEIISPSGELNRLDYWLQAITNIYKESGIYDRTLFCMAGDHGLTPVYYYLNPEVSVIEKISEERQIKIIVKKLSSDEGEGPKLNHHINPTTNKGIDIIVASTAGGNYMLDLFISQEDSKWKQQPLLNQLHDWKTLSGETIDIVNETAFRLRETLDYMVVREETCHSKYTKIRLIAYRDGERVDETITRVNNRVYYDISKKDLLNLRKLSPYKKHSQESQRQYQFLYDKCIIKPNKEDINTWSTENEWRELTMFTPRPGSVSQLAHLYDSDLAGTINLFPKEGIGYNTNVAGRHAGEHFHEKDSFVGFWGKPVKTRQQLQAVVIGSLAPTMFEYLTGKKPKEGWGFDSVWKQLKMNKK